MCREVPPATTAVTITAIFLLQAENPKRFPQDARFTGQLIRQFRLPAGAARGWSYDDKTGKMNGWFKPLAREATTTIGSLMVTAYTPWIVHIRQAEQRLRQEEIKIERSLEHRTLNHRIDFMRISLRATGWLGRQEHHPAAP